MNGAVGGATRQRVLFRRGGGRSSNRKRGCNAGRGGSPLALSGCCCWGVSECRGSFLHVCTPPPQKKPVSRFKKRPRVGGDAKWHHPQAAYAPCEVPTPGANRHTSILLLLLLQLPSHAPWPWPPLACCRRPRHRALDPQRSPPASRATTQGRLAPLPLVPGRGATGTIQRQQTCGSRLWSCRCSASTGCTTPGPSPRTPSARPRRSIGARARRWGTRCSC